MLGKYREKIQTNYWKKGIGEIMELLDICLFINYLLLIIHISILEHKLGELYSEVKNIKRRIEDNRYYEGKIYEMPEE